MKRVELMRGDITTLEVDAIVNAANRSLMGGGGVDGAIHKAGGPKILAECMVITRKQGECPTGEAVITTGGNLKARYVIHAVGPVWENGDNNEDELLAKAYRNSLNLAAANGIKSIAFPNISTGAYGFPKGRAAEIATNTIREFLSENKSLTRLVICCFDEENYKVYKSILNT